MTRSAWCLIALLVGCGSVSVAPQDGGGEVPAAQGGASGAAAGTSGAAGASGGAAGAAGTGGAAGAGPERPWTAPACKYAGTSQPTNQTNVNCTNPDGSYVEITTDGGVPGSGINSWRCQTACGTQAAPEPVIPCTGSNHVYCVPSCAACVAP